MSRSYHQRHRLFHNKKEPNPILFIYEKNGYKIHRYRRIKMKPYGKKYHVGYGGETYIRKYGEILCNVINKTAERMKTRKILNDNIE